jgi:mannose-6-phosphate isomerase-like protein (cupin superfamily)
VGKRIFMTEEQIKEQLTSEGFTDVYVWEDGSNVAYPEHTHEKVTTHVIVKGEMTLVDHEGEKVLKVGDRLDIPSGTVHKATMGPAGCRYVIGEK